MPVVPAAGILPADTAGTSCSSHACHLGRKCAHCWGAHRAFGSWDTSRRAGVSTIDGLPAHPPCRYPKQTPATPPQLDPVTDSRLSASGS